MKQYLIFSDIITYCLLKNDDGDFIKNICDCFQQYFQYRSTEKDPIQMLAKELEKYLEVNGLFSMLFFSIRNAIGHLQNSDYKVVYEDNQIKAKRTMKHCSSCTCNNGFYGASIHIAYIKDSNMYYSEKIKELEDMNLRNQKKLIKYDIINDLKEMIASNEKAILELKKKMEED